MAKNCINNYYNCLDSYKAFRINNKAFWIKYASPLIAYLHKYFFHTTCFLIGANYITFYTLRVEWYTCLIKFKSPSSISKNYLPRQAPNICKCAARPKLQANTYKTSLLAKLLKTPFDTIKTTL